MAGVCWILTSGYELEQESVLVGAGPFVRLLSGGVGQHHLHPHAVHHVAMERRHGIVRTLGTQSGFSRFQNNAL